MFDLDFRRMLITIALMGAVIGGAHRRTHAADLALAVGDYQAGPARADCLR